MMLLMMRNSKDLVQANKEDDVIDVSSKGLGLPDSMSMDWTDEKHNVYLNSLEASFVKQLKVLQSGCWKQNNIERARSQQTIVPAARTHGLMENQKVQRLRSTVDHGDVKLPKRLRNGLDSSEAIHSGSQMAAPFGVLKSSKKLHACYRRPCHEDSVLLNLEVSDQNFVDENQVENHLSRPCSGKRMKTLCSNPTIQVQNNVDLIN